MTRPEEQAEAPEMAALPEPWRTLPGGTPTPNWVAALDEARDRELAEAAGTMEPWPMPPKPASPPSSGE